MAAGGASLGLLPFPVVAGLPSREGGAILSHTGDLLALWGQGGLGCGVLSAASYQAGLAYLSEEALEHGGPIF